VSGVAYGESAENGRKRKGDLFSFAGEEGKIMLMMMKIMRDDVMILRWKILDICANIFILLQLLSLFSLLLFFVGCLKMPQILLSSLQTATSLVFSFFRASFTFS
jgi:hypothetical protein